MRSSEFSGDTEDDVLEGLAAWARHIEYLACTDTIPSFDKPLHICNAMTYLNDLVQEYVRRFSEPCEIPL